MEISEHFKRRLELSSDEQKTLNQLEAMRSTSCCNAANYLRKNDVSVHRGVSPGSASLIFGNDGFSKDLRSRVQVCKLVEALAEEGVDILGFGTDADAVTWTLEVASDDHEELMALVCNAWIDACEDVGGVSLR